MSVRIKYKGAEIASASTDTAKTIKTSGKYCEGDIEVINTQDGGITPSGKKLITDTSETDVAAFATAQVSSDTLLAENIKKDVNILGVVGSFEGGSGGDVEYEITPTSNLSDLVFPIPNNPANADFIFAFTSDISPETLDWTYGAPASGMRIEGTPYNIKMSKMCIVNPSGADTSWTMSITRNTDSITLKGGGGAVRFNSGTTYKAVYHEWGA